MRPDGLGQLKKSTSARTRTRDLPSCSIESQPTTLPHSPSEARLFVYLRIRVREVLMGRSVLNSV
jgi:hypothetical protein